ncbi:MAG: hypothetical protein AAFP19_21200 [Bacteroidota bacterium]
MHNSQVIQLFLSLSKEEKIALRKFLASPYHNSREDVQQLYAYMLRHYRHNRAALSKETVFKHLFPERAYDDKAMRYLMSFLHKCMEQYLIQQAWDKQKIEQQLLLSKIYRERQLTKGLRQTLQRTRRQAAAFPYRDILFYELRYQLESAHYDAQVGEERNAPLNLQEWSQALDMAYLAKKLKQSCFALAHQAVYKVEYDKGLLAPILSYLAHYPQLDEHPAIALYYYFYKAQTEQGDDYFQKLKQGILANIHLLPSKEKHNIYLAAINYCIQRFNKGDEQYLREVFDLYRAGIEQAILFENDVLSRFTYKNIVAIALRLQEYGWTERFIRDYSHKVESRYRESYTHYNQAKLYYHQQKYGEAIQGLQKVAYDDLFLSLDAKVMLLKTYYELGELEVLDSFITSFQRFLQRKKGIGYHQENYQNIIRFTKKLLVLNPYDRIAKQALIEELENTPALAEREWLRTQLLQL